MKSEHFNGEDRQPKNVISGWLTPPRGAKACRLFYGERCVLHKTAGVPDAQAKIQANAFRDFSTMQDEKNSRALATKSDIQEIKLEIEKVRASVEQLRADTDTKIANMKYNLLLWQFAIGLALAAIMAKGFGWIGF